MFGIYQDKHAGSYFGICKLATVTMKNLPRIATVPMDFRIKDISVTHELAYSFIIAGTDNININVPPVYHD